MVDSSDDVRDHSSQQVSSPESSSHSERNGKYQGSAPRNLETEIAWEAGAGDHCKGIVN